MIAALIEQLHNALVLFSSTGRLYALTVGDLESGPGSLLVEAFVANDAGQEVGVREVIVLSTNAHIELGALLGQAARLEVSLANGTRSSFAGDISAVAMLGNDGGFARLRVRILPWIWRLDVRRYTQCVDVKEKQFVDGFASNELFGHQRFRQAALLSAGQREEPRMLT
jgi:type VI secretion system secreted protein VgrG